MSIQTIGERNEQLVAGLRAAADFFEAHPDMPVPFGVRMYAVVGVGWRQPDRFAAVHQAAEVMDVPVDTEDRGRAAKRVFGPVELTVFAPADEQPIPGLPDARPQGTRRVAA